MLVLPARPKAKATTLLSIQLLPNRAVQVGGSEFGKTVARTNQGAGQIISQATVVTLYLLSKVNLRLRPKLFRELRPGTRVVSHDFSMGEWTPEKTAVIEEKMDYIPFHDTRFIDNYWNQHTVHFWIVPANVSGTWKWSIPTLTGKVPYRLEIDQNFQELEGKAFRGSDSIPVEIRNGKINGKAPLLPINGCSKDISLWNPTEK